MNTRARQKVRSRAAGRCEYCRLPQRAIRVTFHIEHIVPKKHRGGDGLGNLALACHWCNRYKGPNLSGIDGVTGEIVPLFHPRRQAWADHFRFVGAEIVGLTPTGRATVSVLNMNSEMLWGIRRTLMDEGLRLAPPPPPKRRRK